jgi:hypothetical protein
MAAASKTAGAMVAAVELTQNQVLQDLLPGAFYMPMYLHVYLMDQLMILG